MTTRSLRSLKTKLCKVLNLLDWKITVSFSDEIESAAIKQDQCSDSVASVVWNEAHKTATIKILPEEILIKDGYTVREALLHELLHILIEGHKPATPDIDLNIERALNQLAGTLNKLLSGKK